MSIQNFKVKSKSTTHLILSFLFLLVMIIYFKYSIASIDSFKDKMVKVYFSVNIIIVFMGVVLLPAPYMKRPFRLFWKIWQGIALAYLINLIMVLLMDKPTFNIFINIIFPELPDNSPEKSYGADCRIFTPENKESRIYNLRESMDVFIIAHFAGWFGKCIVFRNKSMVIFMSIFFEFLELTFRYWLHNFYECWWDSIILDMLGMNLLGMLIGFWLVDRFNMKRYYWFLDQNPSYNNKGIIKKIQYFFNCTQLYISTNKWHMLANLRNYCSTMFIFIFNFLFDLNVFFMKNALNIPPNHFLVTFRTTLLGFYGAVYMSEYYNSFHNNSDNTKLSVSAYIGIFIIILEVLCFFNYKSSLINSF